MWHCSIPCAFKYLPCTCFRGWILPGGWQRRRATSWECPLSSLLLGVFSCGPKLVYYSSNKILAPLFSSVQSLSHVWVFTTPWTVACQASLYITNSQSLPKLTCIESVMPSNHLILCHPLLLLPSVFPDIRIFSNESTLHIRWPKYWSFSFNISPSNEHPGLISFRMDWLDLLEVQGALNSLFQHHSSKALILCCSRLSL